MAYKSTTLYASYGAYYGFSVSFTENSTSTPNNTSNITCSASIWSENRSGWSAGSNSTLTVYWHDNRENYDRYVASISFSGVGSGETKTTSGTINVTHNDDGSLSGYAYAYYGKGGSSAYAPASSGLTTDWTPLTTIARASQPSCITYPNTTSDVGNIGDTITIHMNRKSTSFTHTVRYGWYDKQQIIATNVTDNCQWTIPNDFAEDIPNDKKSWGTIFADTYNGSTLIGTKSVVFWCNVADANPTFDASYLDTNSTTTAITGDNQQIIRNQSLLEIDVSNATAYKYATLSSIKATINGIEYTTTISGSTATFNIGEINVASDTNAIVTLTDSRGFTATQTLALEVLNWELPTAIITLQRENNYYSNTNINVDANYSSLDSHNTITLKTRYKKVTDSSYGAYVTLQDNVTSTLNLDNNYQWDVQVLVQDLLGQTTYNLTLDRGIPIVYFDRMRKSVGVNCFPELDESIELNGFPLGKSVNSYSTSTTDTYSANYVNNLVKRQIATATFTYDKTSLPGGVLTFDTLNSSSSNLTLSNGGIRIGTGISKVLVSANVFFQWTSANQDYLYMAIRKNDTNVSLSIEAQPFNYAFATLSFAPVYVEVEEGDIFYIVSLEGKTGTFRNGQNSYMTIEVVG